MDRERKKEEIGERMVTTLLLINNNREVMMTGTITLILFGIALTIKLIGEIL
jgi:hypothetical protein